MKKLFVYMAVAALLVVTMAAVVKAADPSSQLGSAEITKIKQKAEAKQQAGLPLDNLSSQVPRQDPQTMEITSKLGATKIKVEKIPPELIIKLNKEYLDFITRTLGPEVAKEIEADLVKSSEEFPPEGKEIDLQWVQLSFTEKQ